MLGLLLLGDMLLDMLRLGDFRAAFGLLLLAALDMLLDLPDVFLVRPLLVLLVMLHSLGFAHRNMFLHNLLMHGLLLAVMTLAALLASLRASRPAFAFRFVLLGMFMRASASAFAFRIVPLVSLRGPASRFVPRAVVALAARGARRVAVRAAAGLLQTVRISWEHVFDVHLRQVRFVSRHQ